MSIQITKTYIMNKTHNFHNFALVYFFFMD